MELLLMRMIRETNGTRYYIVAVTPADFILISSYIHISRGEPPRQDMFVCKGGDFQSNNLQKNRDAALNQLLASFKNSSYSGFHHTQAGNKPEEQVSATYLCRPIVHADLCRCCVRSVMLFLLRKCPKQREAVAWDSYRLLICSVRYSTGRKILSVLDDWAWYHHTDPNNHVKAVELEKAMDSLANKLKEQAASGNDGRKYAQGSANYDQDEQSLTLAMQCSPDLAKGDCVKCLSKASVGLRNWAQQKIFQGRIYSTNCYAWFSHISFLEPPRDDFSHVLCD